MLWKRSSRRTVCARFPNCVPSAHKSSTPIRLWPSWKVDSEHSILDDCSKGLRVQTGAAHQSAIDLLLRHQRFRSEEHTSELQSQSNLVCRLLLEKKNNFSHHSS